MMEARRTSFNKSATKGERLVGRSTGVNCRVDWVSETTVMG